MLSDSVIFAMRTPSARCLIALMGALLMAGLHWEVGATVTQVRKMSDATKRRIARLNATLARRDFNVDHYHQSYLLPLMFPKNARGEDVITLSGHSLFALAAAPGSGVARQFGRPFGSEFLSAQFLVVPWNVDSSEMPHDARVFMNHARLLATGFHLANNGEGKYTHLLDSTHLIIPLSSDGRQPQSFTELDGLTSSDVHDAIATTALTADLLHPVMGDIHGFVNAQTTRDTVIQQSGEYQGKYPIGNDYKMNKLDVHVDSILNPLGEGITSAAILSMLFDPHQLGEPPGASHLRQFQKQYGTQLRYLDAHGNLLPPPKAKDDAGWDLPWDEPLDPWNEAAKAIGQF